uniref:Uncharacterized protein n=1 Tax=Triticum urartu TaxID=4572 RepID=A0A8R7UF35_TRIUA
RHGPSSIVKHHSRIADVRTQAARALTASSLETHQLAWRPWVAELPAVVPRRSCISLSSLSSPRSSSTAPSALEPPSTPPPPQAPVLSTLTSLLFRRRAVPVNPTPAVGAAQFTDVNHQWVASPNYIRAQIPSPRHNACEDPSIYVTG